MIPRAHVQLVGSALAFVAANAGWAFAAFRHLGELAQLIAPVAMAVCFQAAANVLAFRLARVPDCARILMFGGVFAVLGSVGVSAVIWYLLVSAGGVPTETALVVPLFATCVGVVLAANAGWSSRPRPGFGE